MDPSPDPREVVAHGYDRIADRYAAWVREDVDDQVVPAYLGQLVARLPAGAMLLDLGCGGGDRLAQLALHFRVTGVDISHAQVVRAQRAVPTARVFQADMTRLSFPSASFDAVTAFYTFTHLPHGELPALLARIAHWLRPEGVLVASMGTSHNPGAFVQDWLGAPTYFSGYDGPTNRLFVERAGLQVLSAREERIREAFEGGASDEVFFWVVARTGVRRLARKPAVTGSWLPAVPSSVTV
jgi:SAM-dependent methyltransferase